MNEGGFEPISKFPLSNTHGSNSIKKILDHHNNIN
jgi:hypothetical protein